MKYIKKTRVFTADSAKELEDSINAFLLKDDEISHLIIDMQYQTTCTHISNAQPILVVYSCMVYYSEPQQ